MNNTLILILVVGTALAFDFTNGFHDTANSVAPTIATGALKPRTAVAFSAVLNIVGAFLSLKVAATIASSIVDQTSVTLAIVFAGLAGAIAWNITTWFFGLPSSSSHALIGGVVGAMFASVGSAGVLWHGIAAKVFVPGIIAPLVALLVAGLATVVSRAATSRVDDGARTIGMRVGQIGASGLQSIAHGTNDAQKTMGIIAATLYSAGYLHADDATKLAPPYWVIIAAQAAIAVGTFYGGWRIIETMGMKLTRITRASGLAANLGAITSINGATHYGIPISTTHAAASSVIGSGVGSGHRVHLRTIRNMATAWVFTLPSAAIVGALTYKLTALPGILGLIFSAALIVALLVWAYRLTLSATKADDVARSVAEARAGEGIASKLPTDSPDNVLELIEEIWPDAHNGK